MDSFRFQYFFIFLLLNFFEIVQQDKVYSIKGPKHINGSIGEDALFMWNTTDQKEILAVSWGIRKGNLPDPQFISVYSHNGNRRVNINEDIGDTLKRRVEFLGNLTIGHAWFVLKNLTVNDTNEYIASISDDVSRVLSYHVRLMVAEKDKEKPKEGPSPTPDNRAAAPNNTTSTVPFLTTKGWRPLNETEAPVQNMAVNMKYILVSLSITLIIVFIFTGGCYCKKRNKSKQEKQHAKSIKKDPTTKLLRAENNDIRDDKNNDNNDNNNEEILLVKKKEPDLAC